MINTPTFWWTTSQYLPKIATFFFPPMITMYYWRMTGKVSNLFKDVCQPSASRTGVGKPRVDLVNISKYFWTNLNSDCSKYLFKLPHLCSSKHSTSHKRVSQNKSCPKWFTIYYLHYNDCVMELWHSAINFKLLDLILKYGCHSSTSNLTNTTWKPQFHPLYLLFHPSYSH